MRAIHIDDEKDSLEVMRLLLKKCCDNVELVASVSSVKEGILAIKKHKPDIVFLDVEMPGQNGFDLLDELDDTPFQVIMVTGYEHYALKAIKYSALDYLLKPLDADDLKKAIDKAAKMNAASIKRMSHYRELSSDDSQEYNSLMISSAGGYKNIELDKVVYAESQSGNYCIFYMQDGSKEVIAKSLTYYENLLPEDRFHRIHRSHLVNVRQVKSFNTAESTVELKSGPKLQVSHRKRSELRAKVSAI